MAGSAEAVGGRTGCSWIALALGMAVVGAALLVTAAPASAGAARKKPPPKPRPPLANLLLSQAVLPSTGGTVTLTYSSANASSCSLSATPSLWSASQRVACTGTTQVQLPASASGGTWVFRFSATGAAGRKASASQTVVERAQPTATLTATPTTLTSSGGSVTLAYQAGNATSCTLGSSPQAWTGGGNPVTVSCSGTYQVTIGSTTAARQWTFTFAAANDQGESVTATQTVTQQAPVRQYASTSTNWSGYVLLSSSVLTEVSGKFQVPHVNCAGAATGVAVAEWVGLGGASDAAGTLLQTGVSSKCVSGVQQNNGWWELLPDYAKYFNGFTIYPGDTIEASVFLGSSGWATRLDDLTTGVSGVMTIGVGWGVMPDTSSTFSLQGSTAVLSYAGAYSADWIVEDYSQSDGSLVEFADYGSVDFTGLTTSLSSWSLGPSNGIALVSSSGAVISTPTLRSDGGFTVRYTG